MNNNNSQIGRPKKEISRSELIEAYNKLQNWNDVALAFDVCPATIYNRKKELNLNRKYCF